MTAATAVGVPRRAVPALAGTFFLFGVLGGTWVSRIPAVQAGLGLGPGALGAALLGVPVGSVAVTLVVGRLASRWAWTVAAGLAANAGALCLPALAPGVASLAVALVALGAASGALDVSVNAQAVVVERALQRSLLSRLHASWSLGGFVGAAAGALAAHTEMPASRHLAVTALAVAGLGVPVAAYLSRCPRPDLPAGADAHRQRRAGWSRDRGVVVFGVVALAAMVVEVAAGDWSGVFLRRTFGVSPTLAAGAFGAFALPHFAVRLVGDRIVEASGRRRLLVAALVVTTGGCALVAAGPTPAVVLAGLAVAGGGVALVIPVAFGSAGRVHGVAPASGVATAAGLSYLGWTLAPPVIGGIGAATDLRVALGVPVVAAAAAALVLVARRDRVTLD